MSNAPRTSLLPLTTEERKFTFGPGGIRCSVDDGDVTDAEWQELEKERKQAIADEMQAMERKVRDVFGPR